MPKPRIAPERQNWSLLPPAALAWNRQKHGPISELPPHSNATGVGVLLSHVLWCHVVGSNWKYILFSSCLNKSYQAKRISITGLYMQIYLESCPTTHWIQQMSPNKSKEWAFNPSWNNPDNLAMTPIIALQTWLQGSNKKGWEEPSSFLPSVCVQWHLTDHKWPHALRSSQLELNARLWSSSLATAGGNPEIAFLPRRTPLLTSESRHATRGGHPACVHHASVLDRPSTLTEVLWAMGGPERLKSTGLDLGSNPDTAADETNPLTSVFPTRVLFSSTQWKQIKWLHNIGMKNK